MKIGYAICGSFCTHGKSLEILESLLPGNDIYPILSEKSYGTDTKFGTARELIHKTETLCGKSVIHTIEQAEAVSRAGFDILVIQPCTGNTLAKMVHGVTDTSVTMAAKAHLRNRRPLLIALSTNDALSGNAPNIGAMLNKKYVFFVPMYQDDPKNKPFSLAFRPEKTFEAIAAAVKGEQLQPVFG